MPYVLLLLVVAATFCVVTVAIIGSAAVWFHVDVVLPNFDLILIIEIVNFAAFKILIFAFANYLERIYDNQRLLVVGMLAIYLSFYQAMATNKTSIFRENPSRYGKNNLKTKRRLHEGEFFGSFFSGFTPFLNVLNRLR